MTLFSWCSIGARVDLFLNVVITSAMLIMLVIDLVVCKRLIPTMSPKAISNHVKFLEGWCNYLDWC